MITKKLFLLFVLALCIDATAQAAKHYCNNASEAAFNTALSTAASDDTVIVNPALAGQTILFTASVPSAILPPGKNLTIEGNGIIFTASGGFRIFNNLSGNYTFSNIKFANIVNTGEGNGGIFQVSGSAVVFKNCIFENNNVNTTLVRMCYGNYVYNGCVFRNNTASTYAPLCYNCTCGVGNNRTFTINNCFFENNQPRSIGLLRHDGNDVYLDCQGSNVSDVALPCSVSNPNDKLLTGDIITWEIGSPVASNVTASFSFSQKTLTVTGTGAMQDFAASPPWAAVGAIMYIAVIRDGVVKVGNNAFKDCSALRQVRFPKSNVNTIGANAFAGCNLLTHIFLMRDQPPSLNPAAFDGLTKSNIGVFVPAPSAYSSDPAWSGFGITSAY